MFQDRDRLYQAYHTLLIVALSWAFTLVIDQYFELRVPVFLCGFFSFLPALVIFLMDLNKKNFITYLVLLSIFPILLLIFWARRFNPLPWLADYNQWFVTYNGSIELYQAAFSHFTIFLVGCLSALLFFLLTRTQLFKIILAAVLFIGMLLLSINEIDVSKAVVAICLFYLVSILIEGYGILYARKAGKQEKKESILYLAPICLLLAVFSITLPSKAEPLQWMAVKYVYHSMRDQIDNWRTDLEYYFSKHESIFMISMTGYSENGGELRNKTGELIQNDRVALNVSGYSKNKAVYLMGSVSNVYDGSGWQSSHSYLVGQEEYKLDYLELVYALARQNVDSLENNLFVERSSLTVELNNIRTKTFFYPLKTCWYEFRTKKSKLNTAEAAISLPKAKGRGASYKQTFYEMNLESDAFRKLLRDTDQFSYDVPAVFRQDSLEWLDNNVLDQDNTKDLDKVMGFYGIMKVRSKMIHENYTELPEELPQRVRNLALRITENYDTTYDKLKAIEAFLQNYSYTLSPKVAPEGQDFIDYFLFDSGEGYCTSYATAMAVLGRCIGIPTRYVEGYIVRFDHKSENGMYPVRNSQAHAWAEAYLEGVGWIPFEATAKFYPERYTKWPEPQKDETDAPNYDDYMSHFEGVIPGVTGTLEQGEQPTASPIENKTKDILYSIMAGVAAVFILIILILTYYSILKIRYKKVYHKADTGKRMYIIFLRILNQLRLEGFKREEQETIQMLSRRVNNHYEFLHVSFPELAKVFMKYRYAEEAVLEEELERFEIYQNGLSAKRRSERNRFLLWLEDFLFLMNNRKLG